LKDENIRNIMLSYLQNSLKLEEKVLDKVIYAYFKQCREKGDNNRVLLIKITDQQGQLPLEKYLASCIDFYTGTSCIQDLLAKIKHWYDKKGGGLFPTLSTSTQFWRNIENEELPTVDCPNCSSFFYKGINIRDDSINRAPIVPISSQLKEEQQLQKAKEAICMLMNSFGGVVVFDCEVEYLSIKAQGRVRTEEEKQTFAMKIE
jgi:hypothetical protein